jgi:hypothetical protein
MAKNNLVVIAKATGGKVVLAESEGVLSAEHEAWLEAAGFDDFKRKDTQWNVIFWPKNQMLKLVFEKNHRGELLFTTKLFGQDVDIFGKKPQLIDGHSELAPKQLARLKARAIKLDAALEAYHDSYTVKR